MSKLIILSSFMLQGWDFPKFPLSLSLVQPAEDRAHLCDMLRVALVLVVLTCDI